VSHDELTFRVEELLLCRVLFVDRAKLEAEVRIVLLARYAHDTQRCLAVECLCGDDGVFVELLLQQGSDSRDDAYAHLGVDGGEIQDGEDDRV
jgi:hypothetical protein